MLLFNFCITKLAYKTEIIKCSERFSHFTLANKKLLTSTTPSLQVIRLGTVFNKTQNTFCFLQQMTANYR